MRRSILSVGLSLMVLLTTVPAAQANVEPETKAGVLAAILRDPFVCARTTNSASSIDRGIAALDIEDRFGHSCAHGGASCEEFWAYTGSHWGRLGWCSQNPAVYPTRLPGRVVICSGPAYSLVRSGPGFHFPAVARVNADTSVAADRVLLATAARNWLDGVAWYRISWHGHAAWVASFRLASPEDGCANWARYWAHRHHT
jgi:hypothetical protein